MVAKNGNVKFIGLAEERSHRTEEFIKLFNEYKGKRIGRIQTSKGCVAKCTFCQRATHGYRSFGADTLEERVIEMKNKYNIGISWKSFNNRYASDKSLELDDFKNVFKIPNCNVFNLQYGDVLDEINNFNNKKNKLMKIEDLDLYNDFEGVAAFLKSLDMFVTISNSTAHLAGSLGVKTILIKPDNYALFHYWNQKNNKTPWYNCVELIDRESFLKGSINLEDYLKSMI